MRPLFVSARSCAALLDEAGHYHARERSALYLNGRALGGEDRSVVTLYDLKPDTDYTLVARRGGVEEAFAFHTAPEVCAMDVRRFGAAGDGVHDDTAALQAAILCCPAGGRVVIERGDFRTGPLFLKSHITVEVKGDATLSLLTDRARFPILPGMTPANNAAGEVLIGSWEGNPLDSFAALLNGVGVEDVRLIGEGTLDGRAQAGDWWLHPKEKVGAYRGRLLFLRDCKAITVQGLRFRNSPSWNIHPLFSEDLAFIDIDVQAPADSPNTDGFDPESCRGVRVYGARFSVGDDCVAIKSGKLYMGRKYRRPSEDIDIAWCAMLDGHGGVTVGSEMAGGVRDVRVRSCLMRGNDRGLRVKTRRGRGEAGVVDDIRFEDVVMEGVKAPLTVNCLYFCDPDGHADWVQSRMKRPVDATTPRVGRVAFERVKATDCAACAAYILGLPEQPVEEIALKDCDFAFARDAAPMIPVMADGVESCLRRGVVAKYVKRLTLEGVRLSGAAGEALEAEAVEEVHRSAR
ncbi:MAG: glycoside hydrolase family 28 protein [Clostridia bacterium]|nr:glycoside hydrolase family 28 protein [Clostridia bacterium]